MKRLIDLATLRRHPRAGEAMVELLEHRGEVLSQVEALIRFPTLDADLGSLPPGISLFVETLTKDGRETLVKAEPHTDQEPYYRTRQRVFEIEHRAGFPSVVATYPEYEFQYLPIMIDCPACGQSSPDNTLDIDDDGDGLVAPCPFCAHPMPVAEPMEETIEQALRRLEMV